MFPLQRVQVRSPVGELRSRTLCSAAKNFFKIKKQFGRNSQTTRAASVQPFPLYRWGNRSPGKFMLLQVGYKSDDVLCAKRIPCMISFNPYKPKREACVLPSFTNKDRAGTCTTCFCVLHNLRLIFTLLSGWKNKIRTVLYDICKLYEIQISMP